MQAYDRASVQVSGDLACMPPACSLFATQLFSMPMPARSNWPVSMQSGKHAGTWHLQRIGALCNAIMQMGYCSGLQQPRMQA